MSEARLMRSETDKMLTGICGGLAAYLDIDPTIVRLAFVLLIPASGVGLLIYLILLFIMPRETAPTAGARTDPTARLKSRAHPQGPTIAGILLVLLGIYLLLDLSWFAWLFWPLVVIGLGFFLINRRR